MVVLFSDTYTDHVVRTTNKDHVVRTATWLCCSLIPIKIM